MTANIESEVNIDHLIHDDLIQDFKASKDLRKPTEGNAEEPWSVVVLRYFNPVGAHPSGRIGN
jgi:UDP-glucose 4-epimerase